MDRLDATWKDKIQEYFTMADLDSDTEDSSDEEKEPPSIIVDTVQEVVYYEDIVCTDDPDVELEKS